MQVQCLLGSPATISATGMVLCACLRLCWAACWLCASPSWMQASMTPLRCQTVIHTAGVRMSVDAMLPMRKRSLAWGAVAFMQAWAHLSCACISARDGTCQDEILAHACEICFLMSSDVHVHRVLCREHSLSALKRMQALWRLAVHTEAGVSI